MQFSIKSNQLKLAQRITRKATLINVFEYPVYIRKIWERRKTPFTKPPPVATIQSKARLDMHAFVSFDRKASLIQEGGDNRRPLVRCMLFKR
jgi:hypothetical protein